MSGRREVIWSQLILELPVPAIMMVLVTFDGGEDGFSGANWQIFQEGAQS